MNDPTSPLGRDIAAVMVELETATGTQTFTWKDDEVPCIPSTLRAGAVIQLGGHAYEVELTLYVRKQHFITVDSTLITVDSSLYTVDSDMPHPVSGRTLVFRGKTYRIGTATEDPARAFYALDLVDVHV